MPVIQVGKQDQVVRGFEWLLGALIGCVRRNTHFYVNGAHYLTVPVNVLTMLQWICYTEELIVNNDSI